MTIVRRGVAVASLVTSVLLLTSCAGDSPSDDSAGPVSHEYLPGLEAYPHLPTGVTAAPVVVMIPGGGWVSADPSGYDELADALAESGILAMPVRIRAAADAVTYPVPVEDVLCALADGAATAREAGIEPTSLVLLGHSSGAHLSAVASLAPETVEPRCEEPLVDADGFVGLAGPYDIREFAPMAEELLGEPPAANPDAWALANPVLLAGRRPEVPALLLHGDADGVVPAWATQGLADALRAGGHESTVDIVPGADHASIYSAEVAGPPVVDWVTSLAG